VNRRVTRRAAPFGIQANRSERWLGAGLGVLAVGAAYLGIGDLRDIAAAIWQQAPLVMVGTGSAAVVPAAASMTVVALILLLRPASRTRTILFGSALGLLAMAPVAPFALYGWTVATLPGEGYARCRPAATRFLTSVWVRGRKAACPARL
jgi:hypothetical protein